MERAGGLQAGGFGYVPPYPNYHGERRREKRIEASDYIYSQLAGYMAILH